MRYKTLVVDPPWDAARGGNMIHYSYKRGGGVEFKLMKNQDILKFPINEFAMEESHLYLWATNSIVRFAYDVMDEWGFKVHCLLVWHKSNGFRPSIFSFRDEFVLFGYRGKLKVKNEPLWIASCFSGKTREYGRKPDEFYQIAEKVSLPPRIDIFSREKRRGWASWGDEVNKFNGS